MFIRNGQEFDIGIWQVVGDVQYPPGWFSDPDARAAFHIIEIDGTPPAVGPNQRAVQGAVVEVDGVWTLQWTVVDLTQEEIDAAHQATVPVEVSKMGLRLALLDAGQWPAAQALVPTWSARLQIDWDTRPAQRRDGAVAIALQSGLDKAALEMDALFIAAAAIQ